MDNKDIITQVEEIFRDQLDDNSIVLTDKTTANDIEDWDSLTHIMLVVAIEKYFKIKFASSEILSWNNISGMISSIELKIKK